MMVPNWSGDMGSFRIDESSGPSPTNKLCTALSTIPGASQTPQTHLFFRKPAASWLRTSVGGDVPRGSPQSGSLKLDLEGQTEHKRLAGGEVWGGAGRKGCAVV